MARQKGKKRVIRAAIVRRAANRHGCNVKDIYVQALPHVSNIVVNMNNIPREVFALARLMAQGKQQGRPRPRPQCYHRAILSS
jgi:hypothetical protein